MRYLLADDPGAGKTIMAGLLIKELLIRGELERCDTSKAGSSLILEGVVTFVLPDGYLQSEKRSFCVDTSSEPPLITASEFGRVITPRR